MPFTFIVTIDTPESVKQNTGRILIAVHCEIKHRRILIDPKFTVIVFVQVDFNDHNCLMMCLSAPRLSQYRHPPSILSALLDVIVTFSPEPLSETTLIVGDNNFDLTYWRHMESSNIEKALALEDLFKRNY